MENNKILTINEKINNLSKERLEELIFTSTSSHNIIQNLDIKPHKNYMKLINKKIDEYELDRSKYKKQQVTSSKERTNEEVFIIGSKCNGQALIKRLLKNSLVDHECALCGLGPEWQGENLVLQLDHINGINTDNRIENLRILCPNCHSQTETYAGKKHRKMRKCGCNEDMWGIYDRCENCYKKTGTRINIQKKTNECDCGKKIYDTAKQCVSCFKNSTHEYYNTKEELEDMIHNQKLSFVAIGKHFNVTDTAIKKRCIKLGIELPKRKNYPKTRKPRAQPNDEYNDVKIPKVVAKQKTAPIKKTNTTIRVTKRQ